MSLRRSRICVVLAALLVGLAGATVVPASASEPATPLAAGRSAIYGGGPFYSGGQAVMDTVKASGFTTVILWTIHVHANGDLVYNDTPVVRNGQYIGDVGWPARLRTLKQAPTSVNRIEIGVGSWGVRDWENIHSLITAQGTGPSSILYRNFQALLTATGADAINDDDESHYHVSSTVQFARMAATIGYRNFALAPYTNSSFWRSVRDQLGAAVDRVYMQGYAGGSGNNPATWNSAMGMTVDPGLWSRHGAGCSQGDNPASVQSKMSAWRSSAGIVGGFMWLYDDIQACSSQGTAAQYANAINTATGDPGTGGGTITGVSGKCVDVNGSNSANGTKIQLWTCNGTAAQRWTRQSNTLRALGKCMDVASGGTANGTKVQLWDCNGTGAQVWQHRADSSLFNSNSGKCLDATGGSGANGTQLIIWTCHGGANQAWRFN